MYVCLFVPPNSHGGRELGDRASLSVSGSNSACATLSLISPRAASGAVVRQGWWSGAWEQVASATWGGVRVQAPPRGAPTSPVCPHHPGLD